MSKFFKTNLYSFDTNNFLKNTRYLNKLKIDMFANLYVKI